MNLSVKSVQPIDNPQIDFERYISHNIASNIDRSTLRSLYGALKSRNCILVGFNDYTKHLINVLPHRVSRVIDLDESFWGIRFREFEVRGLSDIGKTDTLLYVDPHQMYAVQRMLSDVSSSPAFQQIIISNFHKLDISTPLPHSRPERLGEPTSMMGPDTLGLLRQVAYHALQFPGDIAEIGVWQGGSLWNLMRLMEDGKDTRFVHGFDAFDDWPRHNPEAIMCIDEIEKRLGFYSGGFKLYRGMIEKTLSSCTAKKLCFLHLDMGYREEILDWAIRLMSEGGVIQLDNYGHVASWSAKFDMYFERKGIRLIRMPFSYQAFGLIYPQAKKR
ncbi:TylF/MycF/NovP-related O-methyltransferase [Breoghania sp. JC706]|uniref:TylF/MycF/NovP-related O-methyltransferase n=1 Tax=Breoghania sp. JC706 TaxID=3117732 RepID=UPI00300B3E49